MKRGIIFTIVLLSIFCAVTASAGTNGTGRTEFTYDEKQRLATISGPGKRSAKLHYNEKDLLRLVDTDDGSRHSYEYNRLGYLSGFQDATGKTSLETNPDGLIKKIIYPQGEAVNYEYNLNSDLVAVVFGQHFLKFERDLFGKIIRMETPAGLFTFQHDYNNRLMHRQYPNGASSLFEYNEAFRPVHVKHGGPDKKIFLELTYSYNPRGLLETVIERAEGKETKISYSYDQYAQLLKAEYTDGRVYEYFYDAFGNRVKKTVTSGKEVEARYDSHDRLLVYGGKEVNHDASGNVLNIADKVYSHDSWDRLTSAGSSRYIYNALGWRVEEKTNDGKGRRFIHLIDHIPYLLGETGAEDRSYLWADGQCLGQVEKGGTLFFFEDHLGSIRAAMDMAGNIVDLAEYSPFGEPLKRIPNVRFGFGGEEQIDDGTIFLRARYYEPEIGRFLEQDKVLPQLIDEIKQNRFAYGANSPVNFTDSGGGYPCQGSGYDRCTSNYNFVNPSIPPANPVRVWECPCQTVSYLIPDTKRYRRISVPPPGCLTQTDHQNEPLILTIHILSV